MNKTNLPFLPTTRSHVDRITDDCQALFDDKSSTWLNYGDLRAKIEVMATAFESKQRGIVLQCIPRSIEGTIAYLAAIHAGHAVILAPTENTNLKQLIENYQPEWIVTSSNHPQAPYRETAWSLNDLSLYSSNHVLKAIHPDFCLLLLTSGSTGSSKGVRLSYKNMATNTQGILDSLDLSSDSTALAHLPLSYSFGLSILHTQLAAGGRCILSEESMMSSTLWKLAREQKATLFPAVPYQYEMLMRLGIKRLNIPTLNCFLQAGGKMQTPMVKRLLEEISKIENGELHVMYGQTEAAPRISSLPLHAYPEKLGTVGRLLNGGNLTIEDGELYYQGPNVMLGYGTNRNDLALGDVSRGILKTGDLAQVDEDGFITITGRTQRFAKLFGKRIALDDLEKIASIHAFTVAVEGKEKAVLFTLAKTSEQQEEIKADIALQTKIPATWIEVRAISDIPHKPNGKIDYIKIKSMIE